jgi:hypothetical protein
MNNESINKYVAKSEYANLTENERKIRFSMIYANQYISDNQMKFKNIPEINYSEEELNFDYWLQFNVGVCEFSAKCHQCLLMQRCDDILCYLKCDHFVCFNCLCEFYKFNLGLNIKCNFCKKTIQ